MTLIDFLGLGVIVFSSLYLVFTAIFGDSTRVIFRRINEFSKIKLETKRNVEDGTRLHTSLGSGDILTQYGASAFSGLVFLGDLCESASLSDYPPLATSGSGVINLLAQETLRSSNNLENGSVNFEMNNARLTGLTPFAYASGALTVFGDEKISTNLMIGHFGSEIGLLLDASTGKNTINSSASDSITAQSILFANNPNTLIGEELFASTAYVKKEPLQIFSIMLQDILRWVIIIVITVGSILKLAGLW
ncbi:MAG: DUF6754 domain-containing protein [Chloroflexota bacterium]